MEKGTASVNDFSSTRCSLGGQIKCLKGMGTAKYHSRCCNMSCQIPQFAIQHTGLQQTSMFFPSKKAGVLIQKCSTFKYDGTQHLLNPSHQLIINMLTHLMAVSLTVPECSHHSTDSIYRTILRLFHPLAPSLVHSPSRKSARLCWSTGCC